MPEYIIYHVYNSAEPPVLPPVHNAGDKVSKFFSSLSKFFGLIGVALILIAFLPSVIFWIQSLVGGTKDYFKLSKTEIQNLSLSTPKTQISPDYEPPYDPRLPMKNHLTIKSIGVDTDIQEATHDNYGEALKKGVWRVSDFGAPGETGLPVILAAHRFGYIYWTNSFRRLNSFYNLPKLKVGDLIEISWHRRKFKYEVYGEGKGDAITDYSADLILYTCETLNGPIRIFKYARLVKT